MQLVHDIRCSYTMFADLFHWHFRQSTSYATLVALLRIIAALVPLLAIQLQQKLLVDTHEPRYKSLQVINRLLSLMQSMLINRGMANDLSLHGTVHVFHEVKCEGLENGVGGDAVGEEFVEFATDFQ